MQVNDIKIGVYIFFLLISGFLFESVLLPFTCLNMK